MEKLFTQEDIAAIEQDAAEHFEDYWDIRVGTGNATERTLLTISKLKDLIFVEGNEHTGFEHLRGRHAPRSLRNYWIPNSRGVLNLSDPSKFHPAMMPIIDYVKIADAIFTEENRNEEKNRRPDLFDVFVGSYTFRQECVTYRLVVYKGTKIVHTLYPETSNYKDGNSTKFAKGSVTTGFKFPEGYFDLRVPYLNAKELPAYSILFRRFGNDMIERAMMVVHDADGKDAEYYILGERPMERLVPFAREDMELFQYANLTDFETYINEIARKGWIYSTKAVKVPASYFDVQDQPQEVEVLFELDGIKGHAIVRERYTEGSLFYDVSSLTFEADTKEGAKYGVPLTIMPAIVVDESKVIWVDATTEEESELATTIGEAMLRIGPAGFPGLVIELTHG